MKGDPTEIGTEDWTARPKKWNFWVEQCPFSHLQYHYFKFVWFGTRFWLRSFGRHQKSSVNLLNLTTAFIYLPSFIYVVRFPRFPQKTEWVEVSKFPRFLRLLTVVCPIVCQNYYWSARLEKRATFPPSLDYVWPSGAWTKPRKTIVGYQDLEIHVVALAREESLHIFNLEINDDP